MHQNLLLENKIEFFALFSGGPAKCGPWPASRARASAPSPAARGPAAWRVLPRAQAATWAWAGISANQIRPPGPKEARALLAVDLRSTVLLAFRPDKNAPAAPLQKP